MTYRHRLGRTLIKAGEVLTFTYTENSSQKHIAVVAIADIDLSQEMVEFTAGVDRSSRLIFTEEALPAFIEYLSSKSLLHVGPSVAIEFGDIGRPSHRLLDEYRFSINPEAFWDDKLIHRYKHTSFTVFSRQDHTLTVLADVEAPFYISASVVDTEGQLLGMLRLSVLSDNKHTLLSEEDVERIRLALQADISLGVPEIAVLISEVHLIGNPDYGSCRYIKHTDFLTETDHVVQHRINPTQIEQPSDIDYVEPAGG